MPDATSPVQNVTVPSPDDELKKLEQSLTDNQKDAERLKAEIANQKKIAGDVDQREKDLAKVTDDAAKKKKKDLDDFVTREKALLEATGDKQPIKDQEVQARAGLNTLAAAVTAAKADVAAKETALEDAKKNTAKKQADFDKAAALPANAAVLKDAAALVDKANAEGKANNFSHMYFIVLVLEERLAQFEAVDPDTYGTNLNQAAADLTKALNDERTAKDALDAANAAVKDAQKTFDAKKATWIDDALKNIPPGGTSGEPAQPSTAAPAPASTTNTEGSEAASKPEPDPTPTSTANTKGTEAASPA
jgi:hypothetical protein